MGKGSPEKKTKKAKNEFRGKRRVSPASSQEVPKEEVRRRTLEALEHLGHQRFTKEDGGYDLHRWLKGLKTLLDDFEEKVGISSLSEDYIAKRKAVEEEFSKGHDTSQIEAQIEEVRKEETEIRAKLKEESDRIASRLSAIGGEKTNKAQELEQERKKLQSLEQERRSISFFSRLVGKSGPSLEPQQKRVRDLEDGLKMLEEETANLQTVRKSLEGTGVVQGGIYEDLWKRLESLEKKTVELSEARETRVQLIEERAKATQELKNVISGLEFEGEATEEGEGEEKEPVEGSSAEGVGTGKEERQMVKEEEEKEKEHGQHGPAERETESESPKRHKAASRESGHESTASEAQTEKRKKRKVA